MKDLNKLLNQYRDLAREESSLDAMQADAQTMMDEATIAVEGGAPLEDNRVQRKIGDARLKLDLVASRRKFVERSLKSALGAMVVAYQAQVRGSNRLIQARRESIWQRILEANRAFFPDNEKLLIRTLEPLYWPVLSDNDRALWSGQDGSPSGPLSPEKRAQEVNHFISHTRRYSEQLGVTVEILGDEEAWPMQALRRTIHTRDARARRPRRVSQV